MAVLRASSCTNMAEGAVIVLLVKGTPWGRSQMAGQLMV